MSFKWTFSHLPSAIIFDLDGVLADTEYWYREAWQSAAEQVGYDLGPELFSRMVGHSEGGLRAILGAALGDSFPFDDALRIRQRLFNQWLDEGKLRPKAGAKALIELLTEMNIPRAVATGTPYEMAQRKLSLIGLDMHIQIVESAPKSLNGLPNPQCYRRALHRLGTSPHRTLAVEDSSSGVLAARGAGLPVLLIPDLGIVAEEGDDDLLVRFSDLDSFRHALRCGTSHE